MACKAVKLALANALPREAVAEKLGIGKSTLSKWSNQYRQSSKPCCKLSSYNSHRSTLRLMEPDPSYNILWAVHIPWPHTLRQWRPVD
ncbi:helix-turn-helix domain-containing protein [Kordiimonas pumila]|uniref:Helix-turn-helix domain-containing protein n=1 Tax=Kordiimonas pumila TaxID=2161677 RepID=A0ABV7D4P9_9PROT